MFKLPAVFSKIYNRTPIALKEIFASAYALYSNRYKYGAAYDHWSVFLDTSAGWSNAELLEFQNKQLHELVNFVYSRSPFYRKTIDGKKINLEKFSIADLKKFPIIDKTIVRENYDDILTGTSHYRNLTFTSSGTTGTSLHVPTTKESLQREYAFRWHHHAVADAKRGDRFAFFTGHMVIPVARKRPPFFIRNFVDNTVFFSLYHLSEENMDSYIEGVNRLKPKYIEGYPSGIYLIASYINATGKKIHSPRAIFSASEMLHDFQRKAIETAFKTEIFQWYGQVELTVNVHECKKHKLHVKEEYGYLELLDDDGDDAKAGSVGNVVATGWGNTAFPLIRYNTGDNMIVAVDQTCSCGMGGRIIERIVGRDEDSIVTPDGRVIGRLDFVFKAVDTVKESQIIQDAVDRLTIKVVPLKDFSAADEHTIMQSLKERVGDGFSVSIEKVSEIPRSPNGKIRYVISNIKK